MACTSGATKDIVRIVRVFACGIDNLLLSYIVFGVAVEETSDPVFANGSSGIGMASSNTGIRTAWNHTHASRRSNRIQTIYIVTDSELLIFAKFPVRHGPR